MPRPVASVRIRYSDLALDWIEAVADLLEVIEDADAVMLEDAIRDQAENVRRVMWGAVVAGD